MSCGGPHRSISVVVGIPTEVNSILLAEGTVCQNVVPLSLWPCKKPVYSLMCEPKPLREIGNKGFSRIVGTCPHGSRATTGGCKRNLVIRRGIGMRVSGISSSMTVKSRIETNLWPKV
jgi:hypothetical protein